MKLTKQKHAFFLFFILQFLTTIFSISYAAGITVCGASYAERQTCFHDKLVQLIYASSEEEGDSSNLLLTLQQTAPLDLSRQPGLLQPITHTLKREPIHIFPNSLEKMVDILSTGIEDESINLAFTKDSQFIIFPGLIFWDLMCPANFKSQSNPSKVTAHI